MIDYTILGLPLLAYRIHEIKYLYIFNAFLLLKYRELTIGSAKLYIIIGPLGVRELAHTFFCRIAQCMMKFFFYGRMNIHISVWPRNITHIYTNEYICLEMFKY